LAGEVVRGGRKCFWHDRLFNKLPQACALNAAREAEASQVNAAQWDCASIAGQWLTIKKTFKK